MTGSDFITNSNPLDLLTIERKFYGRYLEFLRLTPNQVENQSSKELYKDLEIVNSVLENIKSYGTLKIKITAQGPIIALGSKYH